MCIYTAGAQLKTKEEIYKVDCENTHDCSSFVYLKLS